MSMNCQVTGDRNFPRVLHPLQMRLAGSHAFGAVVGNLALAAGFTLSYYLLAVVAGLAMKRALQDGAPEDVLGMFRFPSTPLLLCRFLYQGTALGTMLLLFYPISPLSTVAGSFGAIACVGIPVWIFKMLTDGVKGQKALYIIEQPSRSRFQTWLIGPGEWVSARRDVLWVFRYSSVLNSYRKGAAWWVVVDFASSLVLASMAALETEDNVSCGHVKGFTVLALIIMLVALCIVGPYARSRDNYADALLLFLQVTEEIFFSAHLYAPNATWCATVASIALLAAVILLVSRGLIDIAAVIFVTATKRREKLQEVAWGSSADDSASYSPMKSPDDTTMSGRSSVGENLLSDGGKGCSEQLTSSLLFSFTDVDFAGIEQQQPLSAPTSAAAAGQSNNSAKNVNSNNGGHNAGYTRVSPVLSPRLLPAALVSPSAQSSAAGHRHSSPIESLPSPPVYPSRAAVSSPFDSLPQSPRGAGRGRRLSNRASSFQLGARGPKASTRADLEATSHFLAGIDSILGSSEIEMTPRAQRSGSKPDPQMSPRQSFNPKPSQTEMTTRTKSTRSASKPVIRMSPPQTFSKGPCRRKSHMSEVGTELPW
ncbi:hypothetical protein DIPPA_17572 [Diplonema papillatum]|nr:hypothetical protein DIPPA_17572 [Diplonema papillatum]